MYLSLKEHCLVENRGFDILTDIFAITTAILNPNELIVNHDLMGEVGCICKYVLEVD